MSLVVCGVYDQAKSQSRCPLLACIDNRRPFWLWSVSGQAYGRVRDEGKQVCAVNKVVVGPPCLKYAADITKTLAHLTHVRVPQWRTEMRKRKVLYISDSLGTPIPHRGIFNFSVAYIETLKKSGASVTLLVERPDGQGIHKHWLESDLALEKSMDPWQNREIYKYLNSGSFKYSLEINEHVDFAARDAAHYSVLKFLERHQVEHIETHVRNIDNDFYLVQGDPIEAQAKQLRKTTRIDFIAKYFDNSSFPYCSEATNIPNDLITETNEYLQLFDGFLSINCVYSNALTRAHNFIPPYPVDCSDYDEVIVDSPHYLSLVHNKPDATSLTLYDLIPLKNTSLSEESHRSFSQKLFASLALDANITFISKASQLEFHECFPERTLRSERIVYPPVRNALSQTDEHTPEAKKYMAEIGRKKQFDWRRALTQQNGALGRYPKFRSLLRSKLVGHRQEWNLSLPYFVTVLSDEPYKNAILCVKAFRKLEGRSNILIVGRMDAPKYVGDEGAPNIHFTGFISDRLKNELIANSAGLIFPSFYEGFGIPVLEGALQGVPVLCSSINVFREIVGDNSLYFDPNSEDDLVARVLETLRDPTAAKARATAAQAFVRERFMQEITL
jgi:glycosyltransferase involved in cell wall biosynthesis